MKRLTRQLRLLIAEKMIAWAFRIMPDRSNEKLSFARAIQIYELDATRGRT